jgi:hypothetical protein
MASLDFGILGNSSVMALSLIHAEKEKLQQRMAKMPPGAARAKLGHAFNKLRLRELALKMEALKPGPERARLGREFNTIRAKMHGFAGDDDFAEAELGDLGSYQSMDLHPLTAPFTPLDAAIRSKQGMIQGFNRRIAQLTHESAAMRDLFKKGALDRQRASFLHQRDQQGTLLHNMLIERKRWQSRHNTVATVTAAQQLRKANAASPAQMLREGGAKLQTPVVVRPHDPYQSGLTLATAPRAQRFYEAQLKVCRNPAHCTYYQKRLTYTNSVLRAAAPGRQTQPALRAEVIRLQRLAAAAQARKDYAMNQRLRQQIERMEQQMRVSAVSAEWSPTAPEVNVAPAMPSNEVVADAPPTALTFTQARSASLSPIEDAAKRDMEADAAVSADSADAETGAEEKPWYVRYALPLALAAAAGIGLAVYGKKGKGAGHFKLLRHGHASSHSTHAAK